jgi:hypothetical protein
MSIGTGIVMLVVGAILRFAINWPNPIIDLGVVGIILMGAGFVALALGVFLALRPKSTITTVVGDRADALPPTRPYNGPTR